MRKFLRRPTQFTHTLQLGFSKHYSTFLTMDNWTRDEMVQDKQTWDIPSIVDYGNKIHMVHLKTDYRMKLAHSIYDGKNWTVEELLPNQSSRYYPALATYDGQIHMVHVDKRTRKLWHSTYTDRRGWNDPVQIPLQKSKLTPALASVNGKLHMVHHGNDSNDLWYSNYTRPTGWTKNQRVGQKSGAPVALAGLNKKLHMVHRGNTSNKIYHSILEDPSTNRWSEVELNDKSSEKSPALVEHNKRLHMIYINDRKLMHSVFDGRQWSSDKIVPNQESFNPPSLADNNGILCLTHRGRSSPNIWFSSYREINDYFSIPNSLRNDLITKFAPIVYFHHEETAFPSNIDWYLRRVELRHRDTVLVPTGQLTMDNLVNQQVNNEHSGFGVHNANFRTKFVDDAARKGDLRTARCYVHIRHAPTSKAIDIQYWFFYPDNPYNSFGVGNHEGDWEHVTVRITNGTHRLLGVYYSIHTEGKWITSPNYLGTSNGGIHPIVYSAKGSHASYNEVGAFDVGIPGFIDLNPNDDDTSDTGKIWDTKSDTVDVGTINNIRNRQHWLRFTGTWGASQGAADSPSTPSFKDKWNDDGGGPLDFRT